MHAINADGTQNIADACKKIDAKMVYISTDYVFDGQGTTPWQPDCKDYAPLNVYGQTKLDGELAVANTLEKYFIVRIAWVFGVNGKNFIKTMLNVGKTHDKLTVVSDQIGTPTYTLDLSRLLVDMIETDKYGYYHATNEGGYISWYDFTKKSLSRQWSLVIQSILRTDLQSHLLPQQSMVCQRQHVRLTADWTRTSLWRMDLSRSLHGRMRCTDICRRLTFRKDIEIMGQIKVQKT